MHNPKKRPPRRESVRTLSHEELERQIGSVASSLTGGQAPVESETSDLEPCWIEPRHLIRILAPFVSMN